MMGLALLLNCLLVTWPPFVVYSMPNNSYIYLIELFYFIQQSSFNQDFFLQLSAFCLTFHAHSHSNEHIRSSSGFNDSPKNTLAYRLKQPRIEQLTFQLAEVWFCVLTKLLCIHFNFIDNYLYNIWPCSIKPNNALATYPECYPIGSCISWLRIRMNGCFT